MATILVVDDLPSNRKVLVALLRQKGHRLVEASDGREGLAIVHATHPDLVITDVLMPVMDGYEFVKRLRFDPVTRAIPVVFYTAQYGEREAKALALSAGAAFVLTKPVDPDAVLETVDRVLTGNWAGSRPDAMPIRTDFDREHLRLVTDKLAEHTEDLRAANGRLRALINIGLELASERNPERLFANVCMAARELFGASYVTLGLVDRHDRTVERLVMEGSETASWIPIGAAVPGILATVVEARRTVRDVNPGGDPANLELPAGHPSIPAFLAAPLASPTHVYGWILLADQSGRPFTEDDEQLLMALGGQVGRIYENDYYLAAAQMERDKAQRYLEAAEVMLLVLDPDGRITLVNRYACALLGWTSEELVGRDFAAACVPARVCDDIRQALREDIAGGSSMVEHPVLNRSGEERLIQWRTSVVHDKNGRIVSRLRSGTDVTERTRAESQLRLQSAALNAAANGIVITNRDGLIEWINPAFSDSSGFSATEAVGRTFRDLIESGIHDRRFYQQLWQTITAGHVWRGEIINRRKDGGLYTEEQTIAPLRDSTGAITHFIAVTQDVTSRRHAEG